MYTEVSPLIAPPSANLEQALAYILSRPHDNYSDDAIPAHVGLLLAYALPKGAEHVVQRELIDRAMAYRALPDQLRGTAPTQKPLGKAHNPAGDGWASPGADYGMKIAAVARQISSH